MSLHPPSALPPPHQSLVMAQIERTKRKIAHGPTVHAIKKAKYQAKQERRLLKEQQQPYDTSCACPSYDKWFSGREEYAVFITADDVRNIRRIRKKDKGITLDVKSHASAENANQRSRLDRIASWVEPFFDLKEVPKQEHATDSDITNTTHRFFIAEGTESVRLMIEKCIKRTQALNSDGYDTTNSNDQRSPSIQIVSILCKPAAFFDEPVCLLDELIKQQCFSHNNSSCSFKIIVGTEEALSEIVGFTVARGAMACGIVPKFREPFKWLKCLLNNTIGTSDTCDKKNESTLCDKQSSVDTIHHANNKPRRILVLDAISNTSNMGSILRTAAAFGIDAIILSDDSCDAWYRQAVRVSMGHVISVPTIRVAEVIEDLNREDAKYYNSGGLPNVLKWLREEMKVKCFAAVVDDDDFTKGDESFPPLVSLESIMKEKDKFPSWICILGNEGNGIRDEVCREADYRIRINMTNDDVDSLSLPIAAGILIHGLSCI